ncbi:MAG: ornithine cyclodeaminase family protein, partial [Candidatus Bathyarchaeia archaeon]
NSMVLVLRQQDLRQVLTVEACIEAVEDAFASLAHGEARLPPRSVLTVDEVNGWVAVMSALLGGESKACAAKIVTSHPMNRTRGLPTVMGMITYLDPDTGMPLAIMEGSYITALRTAAASAVATKYLTREDAEVLGVFGAGWQAYWQVEALKTMRSFRKIKVYDPNPAQRTKFTSHFKVSTDPPIMTVASPREAASDSDVIVTATNSKTPVVEGRWIAPGTHVNGIGSHHPDVRELDSDLIARSKLVVDHEEAALREAGDLIIPIGEGIITSKHIYGQLGEIAAGMKPGRTNPAEITVFKSVGIAIQDVAVAKVAYDAAKKTGVGLEVSFD